MGISLAGTGLHELEALVGREVPLDSFHGALRRAAQSIRPVVETGTCLVTCSDEFQCEVRSSFDRDVARPLMSSLVVGSRRIFTVANMGGRVEPGALTLAGAHFTVRSQREGAKLLLVVIAAHVGRRTSDKEVRYGELDRFGVRSPCCGALTLLLEPPPTAEAVRHPWFDQLTTFFGPGRLATLRADASPTRMVAAASVHAVLQAESALADLLRETPPTPTHVLLVPLVVVNQPGLDGALLAGWHHLYSDGQALHILRGASLRTTPSALSFDTGDGRLRAVSVLDTVEEAPRARTAALHETRRHVADAGPAGLAALHQAQAHSVREHVARVRTQVERVRARPNAWRVYARPLLRGLFQGLSVVAPELGLAALLVQSGHDVARAQHLKRLLASGPTSAEARRVLHDVEAEIQQLGSREAQEVLDTLLAEKSPLFEP